jgi:hypothetical protein
MVSGAPERTYGFLGQTYLFQVLSMQVGDVTLFLPQQ